MSYYQENRPSMGGLADALAMQGRRGDSTLVHMNPMEVRMLEAMSPDGRLSINPETGLPEAFKLKDLAAAALPIAGSVLFPMAAPALFGASSALASPLIAGAIGTGLGGTAAGLVQGKGVGNSLIQGGLSGLMSYGLGSLSGAFAPAAPGANVPTATAPVTGLSGADQAAVGSTFDPMMEAVTGLPAAPEPTGFFGRLGEQLSTPIAPETLGGTTYGSALTAGGSGLLSSALLAPEEMPYDIAGMDDMDAYYAGRIPDLEAGRRRGRAAARQLQSPPSFLTSGGLYERAISPGGGGTFFAAEGGSVPGAFANVPPHVAEEIMQNPEIVNDATAFNNLINTQPSTTDLMMGGGLSSFFLGNYPPHIARAIMQNPQIVNDVNALSNLVNTQPSTKDLIGSSSFFKGLPPHVARGVMQNPEVLTDATAFSNLVAGKASGIQTDQTSNLDAGRLRGQAAARSLNYPSSGSTGSQYYGMATSPGGFGTFLAADGGRVPTDLNINGEPHQLSYINQEEADLLRSLGGSGQDVMGIPAYYDASNDGGDAAGPAGGGVGASNDGGDAAGPAGVAGDVDADTAAAAAAIGEAAAYGDIGSQAVGLGFGGSEGMDSMSAAAQQNAMIGRGIMDVLSPVPTFAVRGIASMLGKGATALGVPGVTESASAAVASQEASQDGSGGDSGVYGRPYGDPYNTEKLQVTQTSASSPVGATALRSLSPTAPRTAGDIYGAATTGGIPRFFTTMAQGGVVRRQDGGDLTADDFYREATVTGIERRLPIQQFVPSQSRGVQESLTSMFPNFTVAPANQIQQSGMTLADVGRLKELMKSGPAAFRLLGMIGMAQGGGISSLAYGGEAAPVGFANKAFEGMVPGPGTGMSDDVPFSIEGNQPALLSRDEYVLPADVVSQLGDGSSSAGADMLDNFISQVRQVKYGNTQQPAPVGPQLMTGLMRQGGVV